MSERAPEDIEKLIDQVGQQIDEIDSTRLLHADVTSKIRELLKKLREKIAALTVIQAKADEIHQQIIGPVSRELGKGNTLAKWGIWIGVAAIPIGILVTLLLPSGAKPAVVSESALRTNATDADFYFPNDEKFRSVVDSIKKLTDEQLVDLVKNEGFTVVRYEGVVDDSNYEYGITGLESRRKINPGIWDISERLVKTDPTADFFFYSCTSSKPWIEATCFKRDFAVIDKAPRTWGEQNTRKLVIVDMGQVSENDTVDVDIRTIMWNNLESSEDEQYNRLSHSVRNYEGSFAFSVKLPTNDPVTGIACETIRLNTQGKANFRLSTIPVDTSSASGVKTLTIHVKEPQVGWGYVIRWDNPQWQKKHKGK